MTTRSVHSLNFSFKYFSTWVKLLDYNNGRSLNSWRLATYDVRNILKNNLTNYLFIFYDCLVDIPILYRCLLEKDPIAQKHAARIEQMRGTYDSLGNRLPPVQQPIKRGRRRKKRTESSDLNLAGKVLIIKTLKMTEKLMLWRSYWYKYCSFYILRFCGRGGCSGCWCRYRLCKVQQLSNENGLRPSIWSLLPGSYSN